MWSGELPRVCLITDGGDAQLASVAPLVEAGARWFQLRVKDASDREFLIRARRLKEILSGTGSLFTINDRADIAAAVGASGLHLGQGDIELTDARLLLPDLCIGISVHDAEEARAAMKADYIGTGSFFSTTTKVGARPLSPDRLRDVLDAYRGPALGIGGITPANVGELPPLGIRRVAVSAAVFAAPKPVLAFLELQSVLLSVVPKEANKS